MKPKASTGVLALTLLAALAIPARLAAQKEREHAIEHHHYTVTDLGTLGGTFSTAQGISEEGKVAGWSLLPGDQTQHSFLWVEGSMIDLGTLGGPNGGGDQGGHFRPNKKGQISGFGQTAVLDPEGFACAFPGPPFICLAFIWQNGFKTRLPTLGGYVSFATDINDRGEAMGGAQNTTLDSTCPVAYQQSKPVVWKRGKIQELPTVSGDPDGQAFAINDEGQVVGISGDCLGPVTHALIWQHGTVTDLGNLGGANGFNAAFGINNSGQVVGRSDLPGDTSFHAFLWQDGVMTDLGILPGYFSSELQSINDHGEMVGQSCNQDFSTCTAILLQDGAMVDLNTLVRAGSDMYLIEGLDINSSGQIAGLAFQQRSGELHAFLATPCDREEVGECGHNSEGDGAARDDAGKRLHITLPESARTLLQKRANVQHHIPEELLVK